MLHARRGFGSTIFHPSAPRFDLSGLLCRRANDYLPGRNDHFQAISHVTKIFCREKQSLGSNYYAVFCFHGRIDVGLATSIFFTRPNAPRSITSGVESSCRSRSVKSWVDQNSSSCSQETNLGMARNVFPILLSLFGSQVHGGHQKIPSSSMELQNDFEEHGGQSTLFQSGKVSSCLGLEQEHFGWFEFAGARIDRVTEYFERRDS